MKQLTPTINFGGGLNLNSNPSLVGDNEFVDMVNMVSFKPGESQKRYGILRYADRVIISPSANFNNSAKNVNYVKSMYRSYKSDGTKKFLVHAGNRIMLGTDISSGTTGSFAAGKTGLNAASMFTYETMNNYVILSSINEMYTYDFNTTFAALGGTPPTAHFCRVHKNYLFLGNVVSGGTAYTSRIHYSAVGDSATWGANNYINIKTEDGDRITGLISMNGILYVFKERSIHAVTGDIFDPTNGDSSVTQVSESIGCKYPKSLSLTPYGVVFVAHDGVRVFNGSSTTLISEKIKPITDDIVTDTAIYPNPGGAVGGYDDKTGWCYIAYRSMVLQGTGDQDTEQLYDKCIVYDFKFNNWYKFDNINAASFASFSGVGDTNEFWFGSAYDGTVYKLNDEFTNDDAPDEVGIANFESTETWSGTGVTQHANAAKVGTQGLVLTSSGAGTLTAVLDLTAGYPLRVGSYPRTSKVINTKASLVEDTLTGNDHIKFSWQINTWTNVTSVYFAITLDYAYGSPGTQMVVWTSPTFTTSSRAATTWHQETIAFEDGVVTGDTDNIEIWKVNGVKIQEVQVGAGTPVTWVSDVRFVSAKTEPIRSILKTKYHDFGKPELEKNFVDFYLNSPVRDFEPSVKVQTSNDERVKTLVLRNNLSNDYIYYIGGTSDDYVCRASKTDGSGETLMCLNTVTGYGRKVVAVDDKYIYSDAGTPANFSQIEKWDLDGNYITGITLSKPAVGSRYPRAMDVDDEYIYYSYLNDTTYDNVYVAIIRKVDMTVMMYKQMEYDDAGYTIASDKDYLWLGRNLYKPFDASYDDGTDYGNLKFVRSLRNGAIYYDVTAQCLDDKCLYFYLAANGNIYKYDRITRKTVKYVASPTAVSGVFVPGTQQMSLCCDHQYLYLYFGIDGTSYTVYRYRKSDMVYVDSFTLTSATDSTLNVTVNNTSYKYGGLRDKPMAYNIWDAGTKISLKFEDSTPGQPVVYTGMSMTYSPKVLR